MKLQKLHMLTVLLVLPVGRAAVADAFEFNPKITDVTVFKDGHALVMARGPAALQDGWCRTRQVPVPILGAFWTFCPDQTLKIETVTAGFVDAEQSRPCLTFDEMLQANTGKRAIIVEQFKDAAPVSHEGTILGIPQDEAGREIEVSRVLPAEYGRYGLYQPPEEIRQTRESKDRPLAGFVMLKTDAGIRLIARENIRGITLADGEPVTKYAEKKPVRQIAVRVLKDGKPAQDAEVGFIYVQKGVRWIPDYRIELLDGGKARVTLQATVINELADFDNANLCLVIGVPSFLMKDDLSPMALREATPQLSSYFAAPRDREGRNARFLSNVIMTQQVAMPSEAERSDRAAGPAGPDVPMEGQREDLFLYKKAGFSLKKGQCAVVPLVEAVVPYEDIYTWDVGPVPPRELLERLSADNQADLFAKLGGARAMHTIRLENTSDQPWTTAPATIFKGGAVLGQQLMTYTSPANKVSVTITTATDLNTRKQEVEVSRKPAGTAGGPVAWVFGGSSSDYTRITLHGKLSLTNFKAQPVRVIITRKMLGTAASASDKGELKVFSTVEDASLAEQGYPTWQWLTWPSWWAQLNPVSQIVWDKTVPAGESATVEYEWYYYYHN